MIPLVLDNWFSWLDLWCALFDVVSMKIYAYASWSWKIDRKQWDDFINEIKIKKKNMQFTLGPSGIMILLDSRFDAMAYCRWNSISNHLYEYVTCEKNVLHQIHVYDHAVTPRL